MKFSAVIAAVSATAAFAAPGAEPSPNNFGAIEKRASFPIPASKGSVTLKAAQSISGTFDGGLKTYGRGVKCTGQVEGGDKDAVFILENGATLKNAIIGADQIEGVHCKGSCTIQNVWWTAVCEDALSLKGDGNASHNGLGTVTIDGFTVVDFGKLYRSCGNCKTMGERNVIVKNVKAYNGKMLTGINSNKGDVATITGTCATSIKEVCAEFQGTTPGHEPKKISSGASDACKFSGVKAC
ncbi:putative pectate lyase [Colletotrichum sublineola]|uniref:Pectate lyase n=1 Tax=Colletotrichum sublineola TaxID=1173701 RepID=A0A066X1Z0_COLSU|nr:putative pectate lyase [Colletotrichum sublineola]